MGNSVIFSGLKVKTLKEIISLNGGADLISSTTDPTSVAVDAAKGSLLLNTSSGAVYKKNDDGSTTNWSAIAAASDLSAYLKKDGSVAMTGDLDLGNNDIVNAASVSSSGSMSVTAPGNLTLSSQNGGGNNVVINAIDGGSHLSAFDTQIDVCRFLDLTSGGTYGGNPITGTMTLKGQNESNIVLTTDNTAFDGISLNATAGGVTLKGKSSSQLSVGGASAATVDVHNATIVNVVDPVNNQDAATKAYTDTQVAGAKAKYTVTAGENLSAGDMVYVCKGSDGGRTSGQAYKLDATNDARVEFAGVVLTGVNSGDTATVQVAGEIAVSGLTVGVPIFASVTTPGGIQASAPTTTNQWIIQVGVAKTTGLLIINGAGSATATKITAGMPDLNSGQMYVGNASNTAAAVTPSGDVTIDNAGVTAISSGVIVNADVNASAAIARSKLASGTNYRILVNNSSGVMSENAALTATRMIASDSNGQLTTVSAGTNGFNLIADSTQAAGYRFRDDRFKNYIINGDIEVDTGGWATYLDNDSVTFQDTGDTVTLNSHGMSAGQTVSFTSIASTTGISTNTLYYVVNPTTNTFQVASTSGGSALALTTNGNGTMVRGLPVNGTGGSAATTLARSTASPLKGAASLTWSKSSANRMGEGFSYDFAIDAAAQSKVLQIGFDYSFASGTFVDGDMTVWIYDKNNTVLIQPAPSTLLNTTGYGKFLATFQAASNSTSYRLIIHTSSVSATAYNLQTDNFSVSEQITSYGAAVTDWVAYTPSGTATNTTYTAQWRRVGDTAEIRFKHTMTGTPAAFSAFEFSLPAGLSADTAKANATGYQALLGIATVEDNGVRTYDYFTVDLAGSTYPIRVAADSVSGTTLTRGSVTNTSPFTFGNGDLIYGYCKVPITGWSSNCVMSADTDTRVVAAQYYLNTNYSTGAANAVIKYDTKIQDTHSAYSTTTGLYTVPVPGFYRVSAVMDTQTNAGGVYVTVNGAAKMYLGNSGVSAVTGGSGTVYCNAGDTLGLYCDASRTFVGAAAPYVNSISIERLSGPAAIAATETVAASFWCSANKSSSTTAPIDFDSKEFDTHGAVTTGASWKFTSPVSATYSVGMLAISTTSTWIQIYKGGVAYKNLGYIVGSTNPGTGALLIRLLAGEYIDLRCVTSATVTGGTLATTSTASISIVRVGNY